MKRTALLALILTLFVGGCLSRPQKGGKSSVVSSSRDFEAVMQQPENPSQGAKQQLEEQRTETTIIPAGAVMSVATPSEDKSRPPTVVQTSYSVPVTNLAVIVRKASAEVGAAQKDTAREIGAVMKGMSGVLYIGVAVFLFGAASLFYPPLKVIVASTTTSLAITASGVVLMVLPSLVASPQTRLLLGLGVLGAIVFLVLSVRNGQKQGFIDANKNGIDDSLEKKDKPRVG